MLEGSLEATSGTLSSCTTSALIEIRNNVLLRLESQGDPLRNPLRYLAAADSFITPTNAWAEASVPSLPAPSTLTWKHFLELVGVGEDDLATLKCISNPKGPHWYLTLLLPLGVQRTVWI